MVEQLKQNKGDGMKTGFLKSSIFFMLVLLSSLSTAASFELSSVAWQKNQPIPTVYHCHNEILPDFTWNNSPAGTKSFVLLIEDPDAARLFGAVWRHAVMYNIPATDHQLNIKNVTLGKTSWGQYHYGAPCPPHKTGVHHYVATLYALDLAPTLAANLDFTAINKIMTQHILGAASFISTINSNE